MKERISIILVNYNGIAYNNKCISSILKSSIADCLQIVIVDNASTDNSLDDLYQNWETHEQVHIIPSEQNWGFSKANNIGIEWSISQGFHYFLLLNNDTEIEADTIEQMLACQKETGCIVVPKILYADRKDTIWCAGGSFSPFIRKPIQRELGKKDVGQSDQNGSCDFANGCCLLLTTDIVEKIGFLDEQFFLYYEDTEYSLRARKNQIGIFYCGKAVVYHKVNGSTRGNENPANAYYITRNWLLCNKTHQKNSIQFFLFCIYFFFNRLAWILIWLLQRKTALVRAVLNGVRDFKLGLFGKYSSRTQG